VAGRLLLICGTLLVWAVELSRGEGSYQHTRDGKTLIWNSRPNSGDVATWSGYRDSEGYAHGFGRLVWYTQEPGFDKPQLYARYWGRMVGGKLEGPVNVHSKRKTHHAIFIDGTRVTGWTAGTAPSRATTRWSMMVAERRTNVEREPESPAAGPVPEKEEGGRQTAEVQESIQDLYSERWPKIDIDDSLRLLAFPPRSLRVR
jgi:hypothetical protein